MSNKSGASSQAITLPSGGGAVSGIGETFSPDLFTGTGNFTVPLKLPAGRNGFQPQLALVYSTGNGNGPFGLGWDLAVAGVSRKTSKGVPRYRDRSPNAREHDIFVLSGSEDLVPVAQPATGVTRFQPRVEGLFARIDRVQTADEDVWKVQSKDGLVSLYGSRLSQSVDRAVVANPAAPNEIFRWNIVSTTDPCGNRIEYQYLRDSGSDGAHRWDQSYLQRVQYIDYEQNGQTRFLASVTFVYEERPDPFSDHRAGFEIRTRLRCTRIEIRTHADDERVSRRYLLVYVDERARAGELPSSSVPLNGVSLLSQVRLEGVDGSTTESLPPLEFAYTRFAPEKQRFQPITAANNALPPRSLADADFEMVNLFGNGLPDLVEMSGGVQFWRNLGNGRFDSPRAMQEVPAGVQLRDPGVQFADMNGDGRADLLVLNQGGYFPLTITGRWSQQGFVQYPTSPAVDFGDDNIRLVDLDGDGVIDALRTAASFELFFNDPRKGWERIETRPRKPLAEFPDLNFSDPRVRLADLTGDNLQDFVLVEQGRIDYWPYLGHGRWGGRITMKNSPVFRDAVPGTGFDPKRVLFGDLDGDGLDDIVYVEPNRLTFWINQGGERWSDATIVGSTPPLTDVDAVRVTDLLGTGMAGVLWTFDRTAGAGSNFQFLDLTGGSKPYLLEQMDNHMGAVTRVGYAPSTRFYLQDFESPTTRWTTPLPFPVQVLERVEVVDRLSGGKLTTEYRYHHGYWDGGEREFRGFGRVDRVDTEVFEEFNAPGLHDTPFAQVDARGFSPPLLTKTWFHLGPVGDDFASRAEADFTSEYWPDDPPALARPAGTRQLLQSLPASRRGDAMRSLGGQIVRTELYALDGSDRTDRPFTVAEFQHGIREERAPPAGDAERPRIFFPHTVAERTTEWERGADPMSRFAFTDDYDAFGQPRRHLSLAVPRGRDYRARASGGAVAPYLGTLTETRFVEGADAGRYMVDRVGATASSEIVNDGRDSVFDLHRRLQSGTSGRRLFSQSFNYYDGEPFVGLPLGQLGAFGLTVRSESLVLTEDILREAYTGASNANATPIPGYLEPDAGSELAGEYPAEFRDALPSLAGYTFADGSDHRARGYFEQRTRVALDVQMPGLPGRGLPVVTRDPLGHDTTIAYDRPFHVLPVQVTDAVGLTTTADYDYRVLQPRLVTDANANRSIVTFNPLGLVTSTVAMGKESETVGDTLQTPGSRVEYGLFAFLDRGQPVSIRTTLREHHVTETDVPPSQRNATIQRVDFFDGFGRALQTRTQTDDVLFGDAAASGPGPANDVLPLDQNDEAGTSAPVTGRRRDAATHNVVVSGWQIYNNKGQVLEKFEPFFARGFDYSSPLDERAEVDRDALGRRVQLRYDARGRVVRTVHPDGSEERVIYGVPLDLTDPTEFSPTPWEVFTYDANDLAPLSASAEGGSLADAAPPAHHFTPSSMVVDALGRTIEVVARNGPDPGDRFRMRSTYDIRGNVLSVVDALDRVAFRHTYDLADRRWRIASVDAGIQRTVFDAAGCEIERRDSKGALIVHRYDRLCRLIRQWARDDDDGAVTLRQRLEYGDAGDPGQSRQERTAMRARNLLGRLHHHYDEAGLITVSAVDFRGDVLDKSRRVIADAPVLSAFDGLPTSTRIAAFQVDWELRPGQTLADREGELLDELVYQTTLSYDALRRATRVQLPRDVEGRRRELRTEYNEGGALRRVRLDDEVFVERIAYDAKGQRAFIAYGNGLMTRSAYDAKTCRLRRQRSERFAQPADVSYTPQGGVVQDCAYDYDLEGNVVRTSDRTPGSGILNNPQALNASEPALAELLASGNGLIRRFEYDPLYRLVSATGRECDRGTARPPFDGAPRCADLTKAIAYTEQYRYDAMNNMLRLEHRSGPAAFIRQFVVAIGSNRLARLKIAEETTTYSVDASGNMRSETASRHFEWNHSNEMKVFRVQTANAEPSLHAHYLCDSAGQRVKKLVRRQGGQVEVTHYIDGSFEHHRTGSGGQPAAANNLVHVMDDQKRIAVVRIGPGIADERLPAVRFHLSDHLGSTGVVADSGGALVNREEFTPFGETSFGGVAKQRYRFRGKEQDEESGLSYYGARFYAPGLARWTSADPAGIAGGPNLFAYVLNNPLRLDDHRGMEPVSFTEDPDNPGHYLVPGETIEIHGAIDRLTKFKDLGLVDYDEEEEWQRKEYYRAKYSPSGTIPAGGYDWQKPPVDEYSMSEEFRTEYPEEAFKVYEGKLAEWETQRKAAKQAYAGYRAEQARTLEKNLRMMDTWGHVGEWIGWATVAGITAVGAAAVAAPATSVGALSLGGGGGAGGGGAAVVNIGAQTGAAAAESGALFEAGASGIVRAGAGRVAAGEVAGGGGVFSATGAEAAFGQTAMSAQTAATAARAQAAETWLFEMLRATSATRTTYPLAEQSEALRMLFHMANTFMK